MEESLVLVDSLFAMIVGGAVELFVFLECLHMAGSNLEQKIHRRLACPHLPTPSSMYHTHHL